MPRKFRSEEPGAVWHVGSRGSNGQNTFVDREDRDDFLALLAKETTERRWLTHAYALMSNHFHILVGTPEANLSVGMQRLLTTYVNRFNKRRGRSGHLFRAHFYSKRIETETQFLECARYIVLNPVRAEIVKTPHESDWTSFASSAGLRTPPPWLATEAIRLYFHPDDPAIGARSFEKFVMSALQPGAFRSKIAS
jgi:putative transposase